MSLLDQLAISALPLVPRPLMRRLSSRYIAGETLEDALSCLRALRARGHPGILDMLGEDVADEEGARAVSRAYVEAAQVSAAAGLDAHVSVKPTHVGLRISEELCHALYDELARTCAELGSFLRVEMEDHTAVDGTLRVFEALRKDHDNVGMVLQARLLRTPDDIAALAPGPLSVRVVKGIYLEPASIAHVDPEPIRQAYVELCRQLFGRGARISFATHDELLAGRLLALCDELALERDRFEFQVLLGVREPLWKAWQEAGHTVRVYVPYGPEWRAYSTRRLRKNPQILRHVLRDLLTPGR